MDVFTTIIDSRWSLKNENKKKLPEMAVVVLVSFTPGENWWKQKYINKTSVWLLVYEGVRIIPCLRQKHFNAFRVASLFVGWISLFLANGYSGKVRANRPTSLITDDRYRIWDNPSRVIAEEYCLLGDCSIILINCEILACLIMQLWLRIGTMFSNAKDFLDCLSIIL